jgi:hypothetical protein
VEHPLLFDLNYFGSSFGTIVDEPRGSSRVRLRAVAKSSPQSKEPPLLHG